MLLSIVRILPSGNSPPFPVELRLLIGVLRPCVHHPLDGLSIESAAKRGLEVPAAIFTGCRVLDGMIVHEIRKHYQVKPQIAQKKT